MSLRRQLRAILELVRGDSYVENPRTQNQQRSEEELGMKTRHCYLIFRSTARITSVLTLCLLQSALAQECADVSGTWHVEDTVTVTINIDGKTETMEDSESGDITIEQNGCAISFHTREVAIDGQTVSLLREGTVTHDRITFSGPMGAVIPGVSYSKNVLTGEGVIEGNVMTVDTTGEMRCTIEGISVVATHKGTAVFTSSGPCCKDSDIDWTSWYAPHCAKPVGLVDGGKMEADSGEWLQEVWDGLFLLLKYYRPGWKPKDEGRVIAKCWFNEGCNKVVLRAPDGDENHVPDCFHGIKWYNWDSGADDYYKPDHGEHKLDCIGYYYNPCSDNLRIEHRRYNYSADCGPPMSSDKKKPCDLNPKCTLPDVTTCRDFETFGPLYRKADDKFFNQDYNDVVRRLPAKLATMTKTIQPGEVQSHSTPIDSILSRVTFGLTWPGSDLDLTLVSPDGRQIRPDTVEQYADIEFSQGPTYERYIVQQPTPGDWIIWVVAVDVPLDGEDYHLEVTGDSSLAFSIVIPETGHHAGETIAIIGELTDNEVGMSGATVAADIERPDGIVDQLTLYDDGNHGDAVSGDGRYGNVYGNATVDGMYTVSGALTGIMDAMGFQRAATARFYVGDTPELSVGDIIFSNDTPLQGETIVLAAIVFNHGAADAANVPVLVYDGYGDDDLLAQRTVDIPAGESATIEVDWVVAEGCRTISVVVQTPDTFLEANYDNNTASQKICAVTTDFNGDGTVEFADLLVLCEQWLAAECVSIGWCNGADLNFDDTVDLRDYAAFATAWDGPKAAAFVRPAAHWKFDEGMGTIAKDSAGTRSGTVHGATWVDGRISGALRFDGVDDYVDCGVHVPEVMSLSLWVYPESLSGTQTLAGESDYSFYQNNVRLELRSGRVRYAFADGATEQVYMFGVTNPNTEEWTHVAVTRDGGQAAIYVNGAEDMSKPYAFVPAACSTALTVGGTASGANPFKGKIDDVRLYDRALSEPEVRELAQAGP